MKNKFIAFSIVFAIMVVLAIPVFAENLGSNGRYTVTQYGSTFYIEDTVAGICLAPIEVRSTGESGVFDFFCEGKSARRIRSAMQLAGIIAGWLGAGPAGSVAGWAAGLIYDEACDYFR
ncbi:MAG: hypothetical protein LBB89_00145 [Treponema sp.]|jgi:hypothetical protein|nr:hypothetical protein [Treponema sp.]